MEISQFDQYDERTRELVCTLMGIAKNVWAIATETGCDNFECENDEIMVIIKKKE